MRDMRRKSDPEGLTHTRWMRALFDRIAPEYDLLNRINSFGLDLFWRNDLIWYIKREHPGKILDLAAGTGDLSIALSRQLRHSQVIASDISLGMLELATQKARRKGVQNMKIMVADAMALPFQENSFNAVTCAFGVRNFPSIPNGFQEIYRVLKPNGMVAILELCEPEDPLFKNGYIWHTHSTIPLMSQIFGGNRDAYGYLVESIKRVPQRETMQSLMDEAGFVRTYYKIYMPGVCGLYVGYKPSDREQELKGIADAWQERIGTDF